MDNANGRGGKEMNNEKGEKEIAGANGRGWLLQIVEEKKKLQEKELDLKKKEEDFIKMKKQV